MEYVSFPSRSQPLFYGAGLAEHLQKFAAKLLRLMWQKGEVIKYVRGNAFDFI